MIADLETDIRHLEAHTPPDKEHFSMTVMGTTYTEKRKQVRRSLLHLKV